MCKIILVYWVVKPITCYLCYYDVIMLRLKCNTWNWMKNSCFIRCIFWLFELIQLHSPAGTVKERSISTWWLWCPIAKCSGRKKSRNCSRSRSALMSSQNCSGYLLFATMKTANARGKKSRTSAGSTITCRWSFSCCAC